MYTQIGSESEVICKDSEDGRSPKSIHIANSLCCASSIAVRLVENISDRNWNREHCLLDIIKPNFNKRLLHQILLWSTSHAG